MKIFHEKTASFYRPYISTDVIVCPAEKPYTYGGGGLSAANADLATYGARKTYLPSQWADSSGYYSIKKLETSSSKTSSFWTFADSLTGNVAPTHALYRHQYSRADWRDNYEGYVHFRHNGNANLLFLDGHVESVTEERFKEVTNAHVLSVSGYRYSWIIDGKYVKRKISWGD